MTNNNQTAPVTDEELDQMIWKLERDGGMTPKMQSLMRELREVRKAKGEPVAWMYDGEDGREYNGHNEFSGGGKGVPLYAAPSAPVVPDLKELEAILDWILMLPCPTPKATHFAMRLAVVIEACRAAMQSDGTLTNEGTMLSPGNSEQLEPVSNRDELKKGLAAIRNSGIAIDGEKILAERDVLNSPATPDGWIPVSERMPEKSGRYWCYVEEQNDLGKSHYEWNCSWNGERWWVESENGGKVTHWQPLPAAPNEVG